MAFPKTKQLPLDNWVELYEYDNNVNAKIEAPNMNFLNIVVVALFHFISTFAAIFVSWKIYLHKYVMKKTEHAKHTRTLKMPYPQTIIGFVARCKQERRFEKVWSTLWHRGSVLKYEKKNKKQSNVNHKTINSFQANILTTTLKEMEETPSSQRIDKIHDPTIHC